MCEPQRKVLAAQEASGENVNGWGLLQPAAPRAEQL
jgi:hypothetical protein